MSTIHDLDLVALVPGFFLLRWAAILIFFCYFSAFYIHYSHHGDPLKWPWHPVKMMKICGLIILMSINYIFGPPLLIARIHWLLLMEDSSLGGYGKRKRKVSSYVCVKDVDYHLPSASTSSSLKKPRLDIYYPSKDLQTSTSSSSLSTLSSYKPSLPTKPSTTTKKRTVIIFIYGGGWHSGSSSLYAPIGINLAARDYVAVIPNYSLYPASATTMVKDIKEVLEWTLQNVESYGNGNPKDVHVIAHSSGAHLLVNGLLHNAIERCDFITTTTPEGGGKGKAEQDQEHEEIVQRAQHYLKQEPQLTTNPPSSPLFPTIHKVAGLIAIAGPYDIPSHFLYEKGRGVEDISCLSRLFSWDGKAREFSPIFLLEDSLSPSPESSSSKRLGHYIRSGLLATYLPPTWLLIHTESDVVVPHTSSLRLYDCLDQLGIRKLRMVDEGDGHASQIYDLFLASGGGRDGREEGEFLKELEEYFK